MKSRRNHKKKKRSLPKLASPIWGLLGLFAKTPSAIPLPPPLALAARKRRNRRLLIVGSIFGVVLFASCLSIYLWLKKAGVLDLDEKQIRGITEYQQTDNSLVFDKNGDKIGELYNNYHIFYPYEKIPIQLVEAVLAIEDRHFFEHSGLDYRGIARAGFALISKRGFTQGGSTITQQLVRNFLLSPEKTIERKLKEAALAIQIERRLSKERILELYLNALFLGQGAYGVGAAAERHFGKPLSQLELHEFALIAGLFQSPSRYNPHRAPEQAKNRQLRVLRAMLEGKFITQKQYRTYLHKPLIYKSQNSINALYAPYFIDAVQEQTEKLLTTNLKGKGLRIYTTLDLGLQQIVSASLRESDDIYRKAAQKLLGIKNQNPRLIEAAALILDPKTGAILAMQGGRDYGSSQFNRALKAKRSPGSSFKPIVYTQALLTGMKWSDTVYVVPITIDNYRPKNAGHDFMTETTLYNAFYRSINTPVIELGQKIGVRNILELAKKMGIQTPLKNQAGTLLGGSELTLLDMGSAYATIANYGRYQEPYMITKITDRTGNILYDTKVSPPRANVVFSDTVAYEMIHGMQSVFRLGTASQFSEWASKAAGKTGTTDEARDNWFCGFTSNLTTVVWLGTDENLSFKGSAAASTLALPIWDRIMKRAMSARPSNSFPVPSTIVLQKVHPQFGYRQESGIEMPFAQGREPNRSSSTLNLIRDTGSYRDYLDR